MCRPRAGQRAVWTRYGSSTSRGDGVLLVGAGSRLVLARFEAVDQVDGPDEAGVEGVQLLGRHPVLAVLAAARGPDRVPLQERSSDAEAGDVAAGAGGWIPRVPLAGDLDGVRLIQDRVEDRLPRQARRERAPAAGLDQRELLRSDGTVQRHQLVLVGGDGPGWQRLAALEPLYGKAVLA